MLTSSVTAVAVLALFLFGTEAIHGFSFAMLFGIGVNRTLRVIMSYVMHPYRPGFSLRSWRGLAGYSFWTWMLSLAVLLRDRSDSLLLGRFSTVAAVGFYSVGIEIAALPTSELVEPLGRAAFSGFSAARQQSVDAAETLLRLIGTAALITLPAGVGLSMVAAPLVALAFGSGWEQAVPVLRIMSLSFIMMVFGHLCQHLLSVHALLGRQVGITMAAALARIALLIALIPPLGLTGAALAAATAVILEQALQVTTVLRRFAIRPGRLGAHVWRPAAATAAMALALWQTGLGWTSATGPLILTEAVAAGAAIYGLALMGIWIAAGQPNGAERDMIALLRRSTA